MSILNTVTRRRLLGLTTVAAAVALTGCAGENAEPDAAGGGTETLNVDYATYNPLSLIIKDQGWLDATLEDEGVEVNWLKSAGSNKANEGLRSDALHVGSTAGSAALLARANGTPIKTIAMYSQPEWSAIVTPAGSDIDSVEDLKGKKIAATKGTDPYFFLVQALQEHGLTVDDVTVENLQHADGWGALNNSSVDAWAGLDPIMAGAEEEGAELTYRNLDFNTYGFLNATEDFLENEPELAQTVIDAYQKAREWAAEHPEETAQILADEAGLEPAIANKVILERSNLDVDPVPGDAQRKVLEAVGPIFVEIGDVSEQSSIDEALDTLFDPSFAENADASTIKE
ncbi:aliphatic sulfonate ABC transporter substrate-binding protein [Zhihengliuella salsuginis]|uniref:ABC transporter substrate-binding protein n=1 Tax=Zhihengliuella salsuginis TaxID=578222 RepID=A0ABQ3GAH0_9MICC|nr:aliphatic sulfonate ABC transporter substrate-binding protein [Zhihengliuella salsuginis]GHC99479.1 ABC transporter substrate-binding protein [Zhihengliuella salsuginis]